ncbi:uncharacterized protein LOC143904796 [Temnothorax americanus]|uniref:uncharacterized protein LOC143904796 n=1 Tax=Temnothorax americanus TaxID=1964332 RepID=UPI0040684E00
MPGPISQFKRGQIIALRNGGMGPTDISAHLNISESSVRRIARRYDTLGHVNPSPIPGRLRGTNAEEDQEILNVIQQSGFHSSRQIRLNVDLTCSDRTVRRRLHNAGYHHRIPAQREVFSHRHKEQRLGFAMEHLG